MFLKIPDVIHAQLLSIATERRARSLDVRAISSTHVQALFIPLLGERLSYQNVLLASSVNAEPEACCLSECDGCPSGNMDVLFDRCLLVHVQFVTQTH